jgi:hypothetical protein
MPLYGQSSGSPRRFNALSCFNVRLMPALPRDPGPIACAIGSIEQMFGAFEQIFGADQQVPQRGKATKGKQGRYPHGRLIGEPSALGRIQCEASSLRTRNGYPL